MRYIGVTHYTAGATTTSPACSSAEPVDFVQINYSVAEREAERHLLPLAAEARHGRDREPTVRRRNAVRQAAPRSRCPRGLATSTATSWAQLLLKFVISHPAVTCAIPATSKVEHLRENMRAGIGAMPDATMRDEIAAAARAAR